MLVTANLKLARNGSRPDDERRRRMELIFVSFLLFLLLLTAIVVLLLLLFSLQTTLSGVIGVVVDGIVDPVILLCLDRHTSSSSSHDDESESESEQHSKVGVVSQSDPSATIACWASRRPSRSA